VTWFVRLEAIQAALALHDFAPDTELRGVVVLGSGKHVVSKKAIRP
jgi:hypothetical protein